MLRIFHELKYRVADRYGRVDGTAVQRMIQDRLHETLCGLQAQGLVAKGWEITYDLDSAHRCDSRLLSDASAFHLVATVRAYAPDERSRREAVAAVEDAMARMSIIIGAMPTAIDTPAAADLDYEEHEDGDADLSVAVGIPKAVWRSVSGDVHALCAAADSFGDDPKFTTEVKIDMAIRALEIVRDAMAAVRRAGSGPA